MSRRHACKFSHDDIALMTFSHGRSGSPTSEWTCIPFMECRAKTCPDGLPGTTVFDHCRYAGYVAEKLMTLLPEEIRKRLPSETPFLVSLHDIGKVSPGFEGKYFIDLLRAKAPDWVDEVLNNGVTTSHAIVGARALQRLFGLDPDHPVLRAVASHHGFMPESLLATKDGTWQEERSALVRALADEFGTCPDAVANADCNAGLLAGLTCVSDWIASDEKLFPPCEDSLSSEGGRARASEAVSKCGFARASFRHGLSFCDVFGFDPRPAQTDFLNAVQAPGVYVLEAPMGMGKTEAALYAAYQLVEAGFHSGIYFALPTRLTSDRIHERVRVFLDKVSSEPSTVKLAHGQAWLMEYESGAEGSDQSANHRPPPWFNPSKRGLLFPFAVGTIDQALMSVLNIKHSFVRSFGLAGKVVILDEVHSYDAYTGTLLDKLVERLSGLGCTVIILSATLTAARRKTLLGEDAPSGDGYPLLAGIRVDSSEQIVRALKPPPSRTVSLRWINAAEESTIAEAVGKARAGCNVLCIANTVPTAQEWFRALKSEMSGDEFPVGLLHAKFTGADRERLENEWMTRLGKPLTDGLDPRPHGSILVATQIVEQSVDIDADWMLSELAPADMLLQRLGRLWRHDRASRPVDAPELAIVCSKIPASLNELPADTKELEIFFGRGVWVYAPYVLLRSLETLRNRKTVSIPDDIRSILETVYSDTVPDSELHRELYAEMKRKAEQLSRLAIMGTGDGLPSRSDDEETAGTRYSSRPSVSLLLVREIDTASNRSEVPATLLDGTCVSISRYCRDFGVTKSLYRNLVQVAMDGRLMAEPVEPEILGRHFFASDMPRICVWDHESGSLKLHKSGAESGYHYTAELGAYRVRNDEPVHASNTSGSSDDDFFFDNDNDW